MDLFEYTDYRSYLRDYYAEQKRRNRSYSYRVFAARAKLGSPNYLKLVIDRSRRITDKNLPQFIRGLKLTRPEADYFKSLVLFQETTDVEAKKTYFGELLKIRNRSLKRLTQVDLARQEILQHWYHWAIREMILLKDFRNDPAWIAERLSNKITVRQAAESLALLQSLQFIKKENDRFVQSEPLIATTDEISSLQIRNLHKQFIDLGAQSILNDPMERREINAVTLAIPKSKVSEMKKMIKEFVNDLNRSFSDEINNEEVYHLVVNFFPLTGRGGVQHVLRGADEKV